MGLNVTTAASGASAEKTLPAWGKGRGVSRIWRLRFRLRWWRLLRRSSLGTPEALENERIGRELRERYERQLPQCEDRSEHERLWIEP